MKKLHSTYLLTACLWAASLCTPLLAQFTLDGEFRPRAEYRHGFGSLIARDAEPGFSIATRARLNAAYKQPGYTFYLSMQDILVWGENRQILPADQNNSFSVFQAWAEVKLGEKWATRFGRQVISYDDQRIFGGLDWAQQGRNHDAALLKFTDSTFLAHLGLAFSQDLASPGGYQSVGNAYNTTGFFTYKTMQYLYLKKTWKYLTGSLILLNNGFQRFDTADEPDGAGYLQTLGTHLEYSRGRVGLALNAFLQDGERPGGLQARWAYLLGLDLTYRPETGPGLGLGMEWISGDDAASPGETGAFFPLYGTNHKFNGFMDYFYVGNHGNSVGLVDLHASANLRLGKNAGLLGRILYFRGAEALPDGNRSLGTEADLVLTRNFDGFSLKVGYSHMFPAEGMFTLKGVDRASAADWQDWAWLMLVIKPGLIR
ncbi:MULTISPECIES: alginate export family protein [unclassified Robiginitalea]|uniref:alginate export family protein n=1 Tax=Robiginitalea TaxID=252306 RepID=UPI00234B076E|nr:MULTISPECIES: alginate export family protein [unclassified Robiginitalea]MDC6354863.1 alginate export family protein [Robiginitalea sp. PM2]MDC6375129.1 alginate export family protein [Robiginitalea sp. SP8]